MKVEWNILGLYFVITNLLAKNFGELQITNSDITGFPMIVGSNERLFAWMDEGFNTFY